jgi:penicillin-binding protein 2
MGFDEWYSYIKKFGFGQKLGIDIPSEKPGLIPSNAFYDRVYGDLRWKFSTIYSLGIGQGEIQIVPLQMANLAALIANKGYYYTPHFVKGIGSSKRTPEKFIEKHETGIEPKYFDYVIQGMEQVVEAGTAARSKIKGISMCGKTGTAQNPHGEDHSVFIAFAPKDNPKIAIAVFVENAGFGGTWAAPIASLMIEKYLTDTITRPPLEKYILDKKFYQLPATVSN